MKKRVLILGAGFGGLELTSALSEALGDSIETTLIDKSDAFVFGFSKLDVMFGHATPASVRLPYRSIAKPGVRLVQETITAIDPERKRVTTDRGAFEADYLVVALGADYDVAATPGLAETGHEFYSVAGAERLREVLPSFKSGKAIVGVCGAPFKCPPAPSEAALLLHDYLEKGGVRDRCDITLVIPFGSPIPPSPDSSRALVAAFAERNITFLPNRRVAALSSGGRAAVLDDGSELPCDLFLGIPRHRAPEVVEASGLTENGWIPVNPRTLETRHPGVYAVGDVSNPGTPKAGVFAEGAARSVATSLIAALLGGGTHKPYAGAGSCYVEFGGGRVGRVDVDFFSGPKPTGAYQEASTALRIEKEHFGSSRRTRWFGKKA
jgi:sulfide:quinone oxidoreductase